MRHPLTQSGLTDLSLSLLQVPYAASDVEDTIVKVLPPEQNFRILTPIIQKMEYHMACGAIQMMTKVGTIIFRNQF